MASQIRRQTWEALHIPVSIFIYPYYAKGNSIPSFSYYSGEFHWCIGVTIASLY